jgi:methionyl aminopeptidase
MTEKQYGGASKHGMKGNLSQTPVMGVESKTSKKKEGSKKTIDAEIEGSDFDNYIKAGKIASEAVRYAKSFIKKDMKLLDIAEKIESKIDELGGKPAFPVNLSINEVAAHYTPAWNDISVAQGLLKVDIGVHIDGFAADTAFSMDLEGSEENRKLIEAAQLALNNAVKLVKGNNNVKLSDIGRTIESSIKSLNLQPIQNLSGHSIEQYNLHSGLTIPNVDNSSKVEIEEGTFAIEPFATTGLGKVRDGRPSGIYFLQKPGAVRDNFARDVLGFIVEEYQSLPFCSRWIYKKFGSRGLLALRQIEQAGLLHNFAQLIEVSNAKVAQAEHTMIISGKDKIVTTE